MISGIEGELVATSVDSVDISINGLTINVVVPSSTVEVIGNIGDKVKLHTTFIHKEDSMVLYGFKDSEFKIAFESEVTVTLAPQCSNPLIILIRLPIPKSITVTFIRLIFSCEFFFYFPTDIVLMVALREYYVFFSILSHKR